MLVTVPSADRVIQCAINVHRTLGPGLFESVYGRCLSLEMASAGLRFQEQLAFPVTYGGLQIGPAFRVDFIVEDELVLEIKSVDVLQRVHLMQVRTYLRLTGLKKGLLMNFNVPVLKDGIRSVVHTY